MMPLVTPGPLRGQEPTASLESCEPLLGLHRLDPLSGLPASWRIQDASHVSDQLAVWVLRNAVETDGEWREEVRQTGVETVTEVMGLCWRLPRRLLKKYGGSRARVLRDSDKKRGGVDALCIVDD